jgi:hypothetical protein
MVCPYIISALDLVFIYFIADHFKNGWEKVVGIGCRGFMQKRVALISNPLLVTW